MTSRVPRLRRRALLAAAVLPVLLAGGGALAQPPVPAPAAAETKPAAEPPQKGLPVELAIPYSRLEAEQQDLASLEAYLKMTAPPGGLPGVAQGIADWFAGLTSGQKKPRPLTIDLLMPNAAALSGQLVSVEGLLQRQGSAEFLLQGTYRLPLRPGPVPPSYTGFLKGGPAGMPALAVGTVEADPQGPILRLREATPAPTLTLVRLARVCELRDDLANYVKAMELYERAAALFGSTKAPGSGVWSGFAMARGGQIAEEKLRDRKKAIAQYQAAWNLEGRVATKKAPGVTVPQTWVLDRSGVWQSKSLREAVGEPLDALERPGFWYRFVDTIVALCGGNAGIGLILLAVVTRLLLYPLTKKQLDSAKAMQKLQPQIKALQEKHGKDKQKFQEDFWRLCKAHKVNPLGGCLPLLIQMPLLYLVYQGIRAYTVQLSHHSFLWMRSLADPDIPLLVLYTISMIAFQKLTMKNQPVSDPQQQQQQNMMVWMMPIMFFMFFQTIASGFILYWLGTNLIYLPQQYLATRSAGGTAGADGQPKESVVTLEAGGAAPNPGSAAPGPPTEPSFLHRLRGWVFGEQPAPPEPKGPLSYEEKKVEEKRRQRRLSRRRRRRL